MTSMNRRGGRQRTADKGQIKLGMFKKLECDIKDLSPGGARLVAPEGAELPDNFVMRIPLYKRPRQCVTRWRSGNEIGVEFQVD